MKIEDKLLEKSKEAFLLSIENFNKPTIVYRLECFAYLICNAWELMLKAHLIKTKGNSSIYYKNNKNRKDNHDCISCTSKTCPFKGKDFKQIKEELKKELHKECEEEEHEE